jgi:hypothetical protein
VRGGCVNCFGSWEWLRASALTRVPLNGPSRLNICRRRSFENNRLISRSSLFFDVLKSVFSCLYSLSANMMRLSFVFQLLLLCLGSVSCAAPTTESPTLTQRAAVSNACGQVVNSGSKSSIDLVQELSNFSTQIQLLRLVWFMSALRLSHSTPQLQLDSCNTTMTLSNSSQL